MSRYSITPAWRIVAPILLLHCACNSAADVLPDHDNGPLTGVFGFPASTEGSEIVARGQYTWDTSFILASHNIDATRGDEDLRLDGETTRLAFRYRHGLANKVDIGIEVPYLWHQAGNLDSFVDSWHDFLPFAGGGARKNRQQDQLEFFYADSQATPVNISNEAHGISDIRLFAGWQLSKSERRSTALRFNVKLPTGNSDQLLGSGGADISLGLASDVVGIWGHEKLNGFYRANITYLGEPDRLADRYNKLVGQLSFGFGYHLHRNVDLGLQSRIRSAVYDSDIENLGATSVSLTFGADFRVSDRYRLVFSVAEDVKVGSAPDVSFQIALRYVTASL